MIFQDRIHYSRKIPYPFIIGFFFSFILLACNTGQDPIIYFRDFNPLSRQGIGKLLSSNEINELQNKHKPYYQLIYHHNRLDSVLIHNIPDFNRIPVTMKFLVLQKGEITIYQSKFNFEGNRHITDAYYVVKPGEANQYIYLPYDGWYVNTFKSDTAYGGYKIIYNAKDTLEEVTSNNFINQLLNKGNFIVRNMPRHKNQPYPVRFNKTFTFSKWLEFKPW